MKFGICNEIFQGWKIDDAMAFAKRAGYDGIEIAPFTLAKYVTDIPAAERQRIRDHATRLGLEISGIHWVLVQAEGMYLNHPDSEVRQRTSTYSCDPLRGERNRGTCPSPIARPVPWKPPASSSAAWAIRPQ